MTDHTTITYCPTCGYRGWKVGSRSERRHRLWFGLVKLLWESHQNPRKHWEDMGRLRYWLTVKAGKYDELWRVPADKIMELIPAMKAMLVGNGRKRTFFIEMDDGSISVRRARSIAWHKMKEDEFIELVNMGMDIVVLMVPSLPRSDALSHLKEITGLNVLEMLE